MKKYKFSSINPNTDKKVFHVVEAKSYDGAVKKVKLMTIGHKQLRDEGLADPKPAKGRKVEALSQMFKF